MLDRQRAAPGPYFDLRRRRHLSAGSFKIRDGFHGGQRTSAIAPRRSLCRKSEGLQMRSDPRKRNVTALFAHPVPCTNTTNGLSMSILRARSLPQCATSRAVTRQDVECFLLVRNLDRCFRCDLGSPEGIWLRHGSRNAWIGNEERESCESLSGSAKPKLTQTTLDC
jgi:hypothetical protein